MDDTAGRVPAIIQEEFSGTDHNQMEHFIYILPVLGLVGLIYRTILSGWVVKQDAGTPR